MPELVTLDDIRAAAARLSGVALRTPLLPLPGASPPLLLKPELLQPTGSFKIRGAYNAICSLPEEIRRRGVVAHSSGNHAAAVAWAAGLLGVPAAVVIPSNAPPGKIAAARASQAEVVICQPGLSARLAATGELIRKHGYTLVPPFDDPAVIAGQGTIGLEIGTDCPQAGLVLVPISGGGLISGIAVYVKYLYPNIRIIGVEPADAASMYESLKAGRRVTLDRVGIFADGVAVKRVGEETFPLCRDHVDEIVLLDADEICAAIQDVFEDTRSIVEPAGALAVAGLKKYIAREGWRDKRVVAINSGANINFDRLRHVAERADLGGEREALLAVTIPERPGSFLRFCELLGNRSVTEFNYRYESEQAAQIFVSFGLAQGRTEKDTVVHALREAGYTVTDMTDNEMAKLHVRYMVGGRARGIRDELLYRFEFPERPGALLKFLQAVGGRWNISLFHYRNHGSDYGRVLAGIQVPPAERADFLQHINELHYAYAEETANPAYRMFLGS